MLNRFILLVFIFCSQYLYGQSTYTGVIDKYPVEMVLNIYSDGISNAIYVYKNFDEPIIISGKIKDNVLLLYEKDKQKKNSAVLTFEKFDIKSKAVNGKWKSLITGKELNISLQKDFEIEPGENIEFENKELLQPVSLKDHYFKILVSKTKDAFEPYVSGVKILQKKSDSVIQVIKTDCQLMGLDNISLGDYNFDGIQDFSLFESSYAGPNTSSLYFLYDPKTKNFYDSQFEGTSLDFDAATKTIHSHNQCCAGSKHINKIYKVVDNKMVLIEQHCFSWDEEKQDLVEVKECD